MNETRIEKRATVRIGWSMPEAPICPVWGQPATPVVYHTGDGWITGWDCQSATMCGPDDFTWGDGDGGIGPLLDWPFVEDYVWDTDWKSAGFQMV